MKTYGELLQEFHEFNTYQEGKGLYLLRHENGKVCRLYLRDTSKGALSGRRTVGALYHGDQLGEVADTVTGLTQNESLFELAEKAIKYFYSAST